MTASIWLAGGGEDVTQSTTTALAQRGFRVVRSFDLRSAMAGQSRCACPHHGTEQCTCQYVVLLVYGLDGAPVVVTAHSRDDCAELQVVDDPNAPTNPAMSGAVRAALEEIALVSQVGRQEVEVHACT